MIELGGEHPQRMQLGGNNGALSHRHASKIARPEDARNWRVMLLRDTSHGLSNPTDAVPLVNCSYMEIQHAPPRSIWSARDPSKRKDKTGLRPSHTAAFQTRPGERRTAPE